LFRGLPEPTEGEIMNRSRRVAVSMLAAVAAGIAPALAHSVEHSQPHQRPARDAQRSAEALARAEVKRMRKADKRAANMRHVTQLKGES
jgi:hypothetical protein